MLTSDQNRVSSSSANCGFSRSCSRDATNILPVAGSPGWERAVKPPRRHRAKREACCPRTDIPRPAKPDLRLIEELAPARARDDRADAAADRSGAARDVIADAEKISLLTTALLRFADIVEKNDVIFALDENRIERQPNPGAEDELGDHIWRIAQSTSNADFAAAVASLPGGKVASALRGFVASNWCWLRRALVAGVVDRR
jgi:hypothetical protein